MGADDNFTDSYMGTIGVDFRFRTINIENKTVKLQIWDTAGQERFRTITSAYYRGADGIIMVYDVTIEESFEHVEKWLSEVDEYVSPNTSKLLLGNKIDLVDSIKVSEEDAKKLAERLGVPFIQTSAKTAANVEKAFLEMAEDLVKNAPSQSDGGSGRNQISITPVKK